MGALPARWRGENGVATAQARSTGPASARVIEKQEGEGVPLGIGCELVKDPLQVRLGIGAALLESVEDTHEDLAGLGARVGLGPKAHLAGDDRGAQFAFAAGMPPAGHCRVSRLRVRLSPFR